MDGSATDSRSFTSSLFVEGKGVLARLDRTGDTKFLWDSRNEAEVAAARAQFNTLKASGYIAFRVSKDGNKSEPVNEFDPNAEALIMAPRAAGG